MEKARDYKKVEAAGGVVNREINGEIEILIIFRRGVWDLPKGVRENGETFEECALREVREETGAVTELEEHLTDTFHTYREEGVPIEKKTVWYSMKLTGSPENLKPQSIEQIEKLKWTPAWKAKQVVGYSNLVEVIGKFEETKRA